MIPKEKAKELYLKMLKYQHQSNKYIERNIICPTAKNCALEAVDEVLKAAFYAKDEVYNFYIEVKIEIEQL